MFFCLGCLKTHCFQELLVLIFNSITMRHTLACDFLFSCLLLYLPHFQAERQGDSMCNPSRPGHGPDTCHGGHKCCWAEKPRGQVQLHRRSYYPEDRAWLEYRQVRNQSELFPVLIPGQHSWTFWIHVCLFVFVFLCCIEEQRQCSLIFELSINSHCLHSVFQPWRW